MKKFIFILIILLLVIGTANDKRRNAVKDAASGVGDEVSYQIKRAFFGLERPPYTPDKHRTLEFGERTRTYWVYVPPCYKHGSPVPMVLNFHGGGGTGEAVEQQSRLNKKADEACFIAVYPNGVSNINQNGRRQYWNAGNDLDLSFINKSVDDVGFVSALIDKLREEYTIDPARIYATGISNGAWMAYRIACDLSEKIAAIAPVSGGLVYKDCAPKKPVSIIHFHGTADPGWPFVGGQSCWTDSVREPIVNTINNWKKFNQCGSVSRVTYKNGGALCETTACADKTEITLCTIERGGHTWPGGYSFPGEQSFPWTKQCALGNNGRGTGRVSQDISATDAIWEFFKTHPKST